MAHQEKTYTYKGKTIRRDPFRYIVDAYGYSNRFKTLVAAKEFIDRMDARGEL